MTIYDKKERTITVKQQEAICDQCKEEFTEKQIIYYQEESSKVYCGACMKKGAGSERETLLFGSTHIKIEEL